MKTLVINSGSSSIKVTVFETKTENVLAEYIVEKLGTKNPNLIIKQNGEKKEKTPKGVTNHTAALHSICDELINPDTGVVKSLSEIKVIGHRVVHGGEYFFYPVIINEPVKKCIEKNSVLAPLHNPANLSGINASENLFSEAVNVAVFDTAFHGTMEKESYLCPLPLEVYKKLGVRKYGFHGTSHKFVFNETAKYLMKNPENCKMITCHLGNGCSIAAIKNGKVIDTSMGLTPLEGLMMGTRCGSIDPAIVFYLSENGYSLSQIKTMLNKESGLAGISGTNDMRELNKLREKGDEYAEIAFKMFTKRIREYIGSYLHALKGADAIVFTGGIGENRNCVREAVMQPLRWSGVMLDQELNNKTIATPGVISNKESRVKVVVMPTNEELEIAREACKLVSV